MLQQRSAVNECWNPNIGFLKYWVKSYWKIWIALKAGNYSIYNSGNKIIFAVEVCEYFQEIYNRSDESNSHFQSIPECITGLLCLKWDLKPGRCTLFGFATQTWWGRNNKQLVNRPRTWAASSQVIYLEFNYLSKCLIDERRTHRLAVFRNLSKLAQHQETRSRNDRFLYIPNYGGFNFKEELWEIRSVGD